MTIAERVKDFFHQEGIHSTTIQPEFIDVRIEMITFRLTFFIFQEEIVSGTVGDKDCILECLKDCSVNTYVEHV
jgi:hypothetical protein